MGISGEISVTVIYDHHISKALPRLYHLFHHAIRRRFHRLSRMRHHIKTVMLHRHLVERVDLASDRRSCLGKRVIFKRIGHRRHHEIRVLYRSHHLAEILLHITCTAFQNGNLALGISYNVIIGNRIQSCKEIHRGYPVHVRSRHMEYLFIDTVIPGLQALDHIRDQSFPALQLRHFALIHINLRLEPALRVGAEEKSKEHIIKHRHRHGGDHEGDSPAEPLPHRGLDLAEPHFILVVCVFASHHLLLF